MSKFNYRERVYVNGNSVKGYGRVVRQHPLHPDCYEVVMEKNSVTTIFQESYIRKIKQDVLLDLIDTFR